jgi:transposase
MSATSNRHSNAQQPTLYVAFELSWTEWKLAFGTGLGASPRLRSVPARKLDQLLEEIAKAKKRFGLPEDATVRSCYEAGRDGFWLHRFLTSQGVDNLVVDSSSIEVKRQGRRRKTDRLDCQKLLTMLLRYGGGEKSVWSVVRVPSVAEEDIRHLHRDLLDLKGERTRHSNRIKGLLVTVGVDLREVGDDFPTQLPLLQTWDGTAVPVELQKRLLREYQRWQLVNAQIRDVENERARRLRTSKEGCLDNVRQLLALRGIGTNSAWLFSIEFFNWRQFRNRRQVAALAGLTPTPYQSGDSSREQGISKAGNRRLRYMAIEIAWCWIRHQPQSALTKWYQQRFAGGKSRLRRIGIVAVARKLLVALWRYLETGEIPAGAKMEPWCKKIGGWKLATSCP